MCRAYDTYQLTQVSHVWMINKKNAVGEGVESTPPPPTPLWSCKTSKTPGRDRVKRLYYYQFPVSFCRMSNCIMSGYSFSVQFYLTLEYRGKHELGQIRTGQAEKGEIWRLPMTNDRCIRECIRECIVDDRHMVAVSDFWILCAFFASDQLYRNQRCNQPGLNRNFLCNICCLLYQYVSNIGYQA